MKNGDVWLFLMVFGIFDIFLTFEIRRVRYAIDYGPRLIGIAKSNLKGQVLPYKTITNCKNNIKTSKKIIQMADEDGAYEIIVGIATDENHPLSYDVIEYNGQLSLNFSTVLASIAINSIPLCSIRLFDERFSTKEAQLRLSRDNLRVQLDAMSAVCIMERYLEDQGVGSLPAKIENFPLPPEIVFLNMEKLLQNLEWKKLNQN